MTPTTHSGKKAWHSLLRSWSSELVARMERATTVLQDCHRAEEAHYREMIFREALRRLIPDKYTVSTGFICGWDEYGKSPQMDILIWDRTQHRPLLEENEFVLLAPDAVQAIIEVKTTLTRESLKKALSQIHLHRHRSWRLAPGAPAPDGWKQQVPDIPFRGILALRHDLPKVRPGPIAACFDELTEYYRTQYGEHALKVITEHGHALKWFNLVDAVCVVDGIEIEQAHLVANHGGATLPGFVSYDLDLDGGSMAFAKFCISLLLSLTRNLPGSGTLEHEVQHEPFPFSQPGICLLFGIGDGVELNLPGRTVPPKTLWRAKPPLWNHAGPEDTP